MEIKGYDPLALLNQWQRELSKVLETRLPHLMGEEAPQSVSDWVPAVDVREEPDRYIITTDVPGVSAKDIEITMEQGVLTIRGERKIEREEKKENYRRIERASGSFFRRLALPDAAEAEKVSATCKDGVLEIVIPKHEKAMPKKIQVQG